MCIAQLWNWLHDMNENSLTRQIFTWDKQIIGSWSKGKCTLFFNSRFSEAFFNNIKLNTGLFRAGMLTGFAQGPLVRRARRPDLCQGSEGSLVFFHKQTLI